jgi:hypothetical protein
MRTDRLLQLEKISVEKAISMHAHMYDFKKRGAFIRLCWRRALGLQAPTYGYEPEQIAFLRKVVEFVVSGLFVICGTTVVRRGMGRIPFRVLGPIFDFLRKAWKAVSKPAKRSKLIEQGFRVLTESQEG